MAALLGAAFVQVAGLLEKLPCSGPHISGSLALGAGARRASVWRNRLPPGWPRKSLCKLLGPRGWLGISALLAPKLASRQRFSASMRPTSPCDPLFPCPACAGWTSRQCAGGPEELQRSFFFARGQHHRPLETFWHSPGECRTAASPPSPNGLSNQALPY